MEDINKAQLQYPRIASISASSFTREKENKIKVVYSTINKTKVKNYDIKNNINIKGIDDSSQNNNQVKLNRYISNQHGKDNYTDNCDTEQNQIKCECKNSKSKRVNDPVDSSSSSQLFISKNGYQNSTDNHHNENSIIYRSYIQQNTKQNKQRKLNQLKIINNILNINKGKNTIKNNKKIPDQNIKHNIVNQSSKIQQNTTNQQKPTQQQQALNYQNPKMPHIIIPSPNSNNKITVSDAHNISKNSIVDTKINQNSHCNTKNHSIANSCLRLLNSNCYQQNQQDYSKKKSKIQHINQNIKNNKPAFGSSQARKLPIFEGGKNNDCQNQTRYSINTNDVSCILSASNTYLKGGEENNNSQMNIILNNSILKNQRSNNNKILTKSQRISQSLALNFDKTKLGFCVSSSIDRIGLKPILKTSPGPGAYNIKSCIKQNKNIELHPLPIKHTFQLFNNASLNKKETLQHIYLVKNNINEQIDIGPGSYNLPTFSTQKQEYVEKEKWKQKFIEKKEKANVLLEKLKENRRNKLIAIQQQSLKKPNSYNTYHKIQNNDNNQQAKSQKKVNSSQKLYRNQLKQLTNSFLPKFNQKSQYSSQNMNKQNSYVSGSSNKYMLSNCFVEKNDHAFQAHYYRPPQKEGDYIFFKGKQQNNTSQGYYNGNKREMNCFKSNVPRIVF